MPRFRKLLLAGMAVVVAYFVTFVWPKTNSLLVDIDGSPRAQAARKLEPYDLRSLEVLNRVLLEVNDAYVEPARVKPRQMLLAGLNAIQRSVPPVLIDYDEGKDELSVQVNDERRTFPVGDVDTVWGLGERFKAVFDFLQTHLQQEDLDPREVEYAAVNGMLHTLDPHTVLLTPEIAEEMQTNTRGEFGGLGIVISIRDGHLTVIRPMPNTPASQAGLERWDRIVKINDESTLNMPLTEAVDRLRGAPGSRVTVWIRRKGSNGAWSAPRRVELIRAVIHIESVESRMLSDHIGYVQIRSFQGNTYEDMRQALAQLRRKNMKGLVLDLRDDPGGLLEQAVRIADAFLESGTIVVTSSNDPSDRDERLARAEHTEPSYPMVVLVNGGSASASEIVAGALKNHNRALIVGQRTFGKGSVQVVNKLADGSALKLTISQYLTPGDVSIQGVGIVPDIAIDPMTVDREDMDLAVDDGYLRESDLRAALTHDRAERAGTPATVLRYYLPREVRRRLREATPEEGEENEPEDEFLTRFSQRLLSRAKSADRRTLLEQAKAVIEQVRQEEMKRAVAELRKLGIDWNVGSDEGPSKIAVQATTNAPDNTVRSGEPLKLRVKVTNKGEHPLYRLRAVTKSDFRLFDERELVFGRLDPGQTRQWSTTLGVCESEQERRICRIPRNTPDRADGIRIEFEEAHGHAPEASEVRTVIRALDRPQFAYAIQIADNLRGNGDGKVQRGERVSMYLRIKNVGLGRTYETQANLRNLAGHGLLLQDGRFHLDGIEPQEERTVRFSFEVLPSFKDDEAKLEVSVVDLELRESVNERVLVPIEHGGGRSPSAVSSTVHVKDGALLREAPSGNADVVARAVRGARFHAEAKLGDYLRIKLDGDRPAWVLESDLTQAAQAGSLDFHVNHMPPRIEFNGAPTLVTQSDTLRIDGIARDDRQLRDVYVFVGGRKVFYKSNSGSKSGREVPFTTDVPLHGGVNYVTVFARENDDVVTRQLLVVRRDAPDGSLMETPRFDDNPFEMNLEDERL